jgi:hypothetical protein
MISKFFMGMAHGAGIVAGIMVNIMLVQFSAALLEKLNLLPL